MVAIRNPQLHVEPIEGHPGERRVIVTYDLDISASDPVIGSTLCEDVVVTARDVHDAPVFPTGFEARLRGEVDPAVAGSDARRLATEVHRADLDVEQDWWRTNEGGAFEPIAEFSDHLVAELRLSVDDETVAQATTPMVTGSWGALGSD